VAACTAQVGVSWAIAATRVVDNRHHPADIVAGFILGATVAIIFLLRSIPTLRCAEASAATSYPLCMQPCHWSAGHSREACTHTSIYACKVSEHGEARAQPQLRLHSILEGHIF
jgi:hypothetical protein